VDPRIRLVDGRYWFDDEYRVSLPAWSVRRELGAPYRAINSRHVRDRILASEEVILGGWRFPSDLPARSKRLPCFHQVTRRANKSFSRRPVGSAVT
jgi:hypothetical protein